MHPSIKDKLRLFEYGHLPLHLQEVSKPFHTLAYDTANKLKDSPAGAQVTICLQKLWEAKNEAVVAAVQIADPPDDEG